MNANKDLMNDLDPTAPVTEQASHWWVLLNSGPATPADYKAFGEWAARSPERVEAFLKTALLTKALKSNTLPWPDTPLEELARQVREAGDVVQFPHPSAIPTSSANIASHWARRPILVFAVAASIFALTAGLWLFSNQPNRYATGVGEQRSVMLSDGSLITLNTASRVEVKLEDNRRSIELLAGEVLFQVAKDSARPFDVVVGDTTVRAIGTQFNVNKTAAGATVTVVEGKVAVSSSGYEFLSAPEVNPPSKISASQGEGVAYLTAGEQLTVSQDTRNISVSKPTNIAITVAWTQRRLVFEHRPLGDVANEFNRYNTNEIHIQSPTLRAQEVTGVFQANDPESFLNFISNIPGVRIERDAGQITVFDSP